MNCQWQNNMSEEYFAMKKRMKDGLQILQKYAWLLDSFMLDFFTENHWEKLPSNWKSCFDVIELKELGLLLDYRKAEISFKRVLPLSFLALRKAACSLSLARDQSALSNTISNESDIKVGLLNDSSQNVNPPRNVLLPSKLKTTENFGNELLTNPRFSHVFIKHVKPKKRHEVCLMAKIIAETAKTMGCKYIVDIGSGLGHLARMLAYGYNLQVCCLETQDYLAEQARKLDLELEMTVTKYVLQSQKTDFCRPVHLNCTLHSSVDENFFTQNLKTAFGVEDSNFSFGMVGLHPCGDLGPILLRLFKKCPNAMFINTFGCCYMKLTTGGNSTHVDFNGYPLSNFISQQVHNLSYEAREIACHAIENYCDRLCSGNVSDLKVHCYRATLERILVKFWPHLRHSGIRSIRNANNLPFEKYCQIATERLGVIIPKDEILNKNTLDNLSQWKRVVVFYSLRLLLAPLVETILLCDRLFYLMELGLNASVMPVFDPSLSPRNHILIAIKQNDDCN